MTHRLDHIENVARHAGRMALELREKGLKSSTKEDGSVVTNADLAVQEFILGELRHKYSDYAILAEEECCDIGKVEPGQPVWVVDPIDGTDSYRSGMAYFAVSIGLYQDGEFPLGVIYLPAVDEMYSVDVRKAPRKNGEQISVNDCNQIDDNSFLAAPSTFHRHFYTTFPGKIRSLGSTAHHCALVASGGAVGAILYGHLWDIAAGVALITAAGGQIRRVSDEPIAWEDYSDGGNLPFDLLASHENLYDTIRNTMARKG